jgi:predicted TIM-barrel fold metal-dependent hydrolase
MRWNIVLLTAGLAVAALAQELTVEQWTPRSTLVVEEHLVQRAKFPVIDVHSHHRANSSRERLDEVVGEMDKLNLQVLVNLSGGTGAQLEQAVKTFRQGPYPKRFAVFANLNFDGIDDADWGTTAAAGLARDIANGAQGLKFFKNFGMSVRYAGGKRMTVDDPKLIPVFEVCAREKIPVLIHVGEPSEFFKPHDEFNERWLELKLRPNRKRPPEPSFERLIGERDRMMQRHPSVNFIYAHMGWHGNDLGRLGKLFDENPNLYVDVAAVLYEFGRVPVSGRAFMVKYADRILFGKDTFTPSEFPYYWRVFETNDEYFDYYRRYHAHWQLYGLGLPDDVLKKVYYKNALRLIPGIDGSAFPE